MNLETLNECASCRWWKPINGSHLCLDGHCYFSKENPVQKVRNDCCYGFKPIDDKGDLS